MNIYSPFCLASFWSPLSFALRDITLQQTYSVATYLRLEFLRNCDCSFYVITAVSRMQQQYHTCNSSITHATAVSRMQQQYHACNSSITHATAVSRMQQQYYACDSSSNDTHATAVAVTMTCMQQQ